MIQLYDYFRSSSAYRVRIALHHKEIAFESIHVDLVKGEQRSAEYKKLNPIAGVPTLIDSAYRLTQSSAILEYLEETYPQKPLLPKDKKVRGYIRQLAMLIATDIHPLNNLKVWKGYVGKVLGANEEQQKNWYDHWIHEGLSAYENLLKSENKHGDFSFGSEPTLADLFLIPQLYNARRFNTDLHAYPEICKIEQNCIKLSAFKRAAPENHPFAPDGLEKIHG